MIIVLLEFCNLGVKKRCRISLFIGNLFSFTQKLKSYKCRQKKYLHFVLESLQERITVGRFTYAEFFLKIETLLIAMILGYLSV